MDRRGGGVPAFGETGFRRKGSINRWSPIPTTKVYEKNGARKNRTPLRTQMYWYVLKTYFMYPNTCTKTYAWHYLLRCRWNALSRNGRWKCSLSRLKSRVELRFLVSRYPRASLVRIAAMSVGAWMHALRSSSSTACALPVACASDVMRQKTCSWLHSVLFVPHDWISAPSTCTFRSIINRMTSCFFVPW